TRRRYPCPYRYPCPCRYRCPCRCPYRYPCPCRYPCPYRCRNPRPCPRRCRNRCRCPPRCRRCRPFRRTRATVPRCSKGSCSFLLRHTSSRGIGDDQSRLRQEKRKPERQQQRVERHPEPRRIELLVEPLADEHTQHDGRGAPQHEVGGMLLPEPAGDVSDDDREAEEEVERLQRRAR